MDNFHLMVVSLAVALSTSGGDSAPDRKLNSDSAPDIKLEGFIKIENNSTAYELLCRSNTDFLGCTVEFLLNGKTQVNIRYENDTCYKGIGVCSHFQCDCLDGCNAFTWYYTENRGIENLLFECDARIMDNRIFYQVTASGSFNRGDYVVGKKIVKIISGNPPPSQRAPINTDSTEGTFRKDKNNSYFNNLMITIQTVFIFLIFIIMCIFLCIRIWNCYKINRGKEEQSHRKKPLI